MAMAGIVYSGPQSQDNFSVKMSYVLSLLKIKNNPVLLPLFTDVHKLTTAHYKLSGDNRAVVDL